MLPPPIDRRGFLGRAAISAIPFAVANGCGLASPSGDVERFRVSGPSMAPTLLSDHRLARCGRCDLTIPVQRSLMPASGETIRCWHCGDQLPVPAGEWFPGDWLEVRPLGSEPLRLGDLVAVQHAGTLRVKRIFALPGSVVGLDERRLTVDGRRLEDEMDGRLPLIPVDFDHRREKSRWRGLKTNARGEQDSSYVRRAGSGHTAHGNSVNGGDWRREGKSWCCEGRADGSWLVYEHRSVHDHGLPGPVRDDYPGNVTVSRQLSPVERLALRLEVECERPGRLQLVCWRPSGAVSAEVAVERPGKITLRPNRPAPGVDAPVDSRAPLALRASSGTGWQLSKISVERSIEYRLGRDHEASGYPRSLGPEQAFVVGDNVPLSVDSRDWGPIDRSEIVGRIVIATPSAG